jgi:Skp family chaperone for outer membrane proteins
MLNPFNFGVYIKAFAMIVAVGFGAYRIGLWQGEGHGYAKRDREIAAERKQINEQLTVLNAQLDEARAKLEAGREQASADVTKTLKDITPAVRAKCSKECSLPQSTREALEAIQ